MLADIGNGMQHTLRVTGVACVLAMLGTAGMDTFGDNHATTITLQDLGVLQLVAHDLFDVKRGDGETPESATDFENGKLDLSTLFVNMTSGNYFEDEIVAKGGEERNRENIIMFTVSSALGEEYLGFINMGDSPDVARAKTLAMYHEMFATSYNNAFGEQIPEKGGGRATPDGNIALRTVHDFLPGSITVDGAVTELLSIPPNNKLSDSDMMQPSSPLDGSLDEEFFEIDIAHPDGPMIMVNLLEADRSFGDQFSTKFSFDDLLAELVDGEYDANDKAMVGIRNLISGAYPETRGDETGPPANEPPTVNAGAGQEVREGDTVTLEGTAVDADDDHLTYVWTHDSNLPIELADETSPSTTFIVPAVTADTTITFTLTVSDSINADVADQVEIAVTDSVVAMVQGTVFSDTNGNGVKDVGEEGIGGYAMTAVDVLTGATRTAATDYLGAYAFENVRAYPHSTLVQTGFFPVGHVVADLDASWYTYALPASSGTTTFDVGFYRVPADGLVTLNITAFVDANGNGAVDPGEGVAGLDDFYVYTYVCGPTDGVTLLTGENATGANGKITVDVLPADFGVFVNVATLGDAGYVWHTTSYERSDGAAGKAFDAGVPVADDPEPGSTHTMRLGLVPTS